MRLSIVIPCLDQAAGILATLQSLQPLRRNGHEVIIVDAGGDGTREIAGPFADRVLRAPRGRAVQMNRGATVATGEFVKWLEAQAPSKTGPSGIGKENYTWQLRNVHLVPLTWEEEVTLLQRELDRAVAMLLLEEHNNRELAPMVAISPDGGGRSPAAGRAAPSRPVAGHSRVPYGR